MLSKHILICLPKVVFEDAFPAREAKSTRTEYIVSTTRFELTTSFTFVWPTTVFGPITIMLSACPAVLRVLCVGEICWIVIV